MAFSFSFRYPSFKVVERTFNADNALYEVWDGTGTIATHQYYAHGVTAQVSLGNGILLSLTQDDEDKETGRDLHIKRYHCLQHGHGLGFQGQRGPGRPKTGAGPIS